MSQYPSPVVRFWRARPWNGNPLMRSSDRWEAIVWLLAAMVVLMAVPIAGATGTAGYTSAAERIRTQNAVTVAVTATVTGEPERMVTAAGYGGIEERFEAPVRWSHDGRVGSAKVTVPGATEAGSHVPVWLDPDGKVTAPPRPSSDAAWSGIMFGLAALIGMWCAATALVLSTGWLLGRIRSARWESEWRWMSRPIGK